MPALKALARSLLFMVPVIAALALLPLELSLLAIIALTAGFILLDARKNPVLFKMAARSVVRRRSTTALVLGGLMVGTAIIAASFVVGDTMTNMIVGEVTKSSGEVDFLIGAETDLGWKYFGSNDQALVRDDLSQVDGVGSVEWAVLGSTGISDTTSSVMTSASYMGVTPELTERFGGFRDLDGNRFTEVPGPGYVYMNEKLAKDLDAHVGDSLVILRGETGTINVTLHQIVQDRYLGGFQGDSRIIMDLATAQSISGSPGHSNFIMVSLEGSVGDDTASTGPIREELNKTLADYPDFGLTIQFDRSKTLEQGKEDMSMFTSLFLVMGSFSIIAGIALVINIFTMLAEERKSEMGMARAIGMPRTDLRKLFTFEGLIYALVAAGIGAAVGLGLAYFIIMGIAMIMDMGGVAIDQYFTFTPFSLIMAYAAGFLLTIVTVYLTTRRISNMNIVRAVRNIPEPPVSRDDRRTFRLGLAALGGGFLLMLLGIAFEALAPALSGLTLVSLSLALLLRKYIPERAAWNIAGFGSLIIWMPLPFDIFPYSGNIEMFAVAGIFMVTSFLVLVMFNSDQIIRALTKVLRVKGGYIAVVKTAFSYPLKAKFRTALNIFIFGLVIFTVTVLTMISGVLAVGIPQMISETSGGFDIIGFTDPSIEGTIDPWTDIQASKGLLHKENITYVVPLLSTSPYIIKEEVPSAADNALHDKFRYSVVGFNSSLYTEGNYPLLEYNIALYSSEEQAWEAVLNDPALCMIDGSGASTDGITGMMSGGSAVSGLKVGDKITVVANNGSGENNTVLTIAGIMKQSFFGGVFVTKDVVKDKLMAPYPNIFLIKVAPGVDVDRQAILLEKDYMSLGMTTISMAGMAQEVTAQINGVFNLLKAFLAMGLIIGISGLGIITMRSINERKIEIGMMRAIGYTRRMVITNFAMESALISVLGILGGTFLGIVLGYRLWDTGFGFRSLNFPFVLDWAPLVLVGAGAFLATLLCVYPAARGASKVSPAEVLRFE